MTSFAPSTSPPRPLPTSTTTASERQLTLRLYNLTVVIRVLLSAFLHVVCLDYISRIKKQIMAVAIHKVCRSSTSSTEDSEEMINSDSEESCSSFEYIDDAAGYMFALKSTKSRKRNLMRNGINDVDLEDQRLTKSPTIYHSDICPRLFVTEAPHEPAVLSDEYSSATSIRKHCSRKSGDFTLPLSPINVPGSMAVTGISDSLGTEFVRVLSPQTSCTNNSSKNNTAIEKTLTSVDSSELASMLLSNSSSFLILDCRSFMKYNANHIAGSLNACCTNPTIKKRFRDGKIGLSELISGPEGKARFKNATAASDCLVVVYDDESVDLGSTPPESNCLAAIAGRLSTMGLSVGYLNGGLKDFLTKYPHLCSQPTAIEPRPILFSPTSPYVDAAIDTTLMTEILPYLYLGNEKDAANVEKLRELNFTHVLNVSASIPLFCETLLPPGTIQCLRLPASDSGSQNIKQYFAEAVRFIESARLCGGKVLIHCQAGVSRSPTITMAYLMARFGCASFEAFSTVKAKRAIISPNINFMGQLLEFETWSKDLLARSLGVTAAADWEAQNS